MAFEELKERQSVVWSSGPDQDITETVADVHADVRELARVTKRGGRTYVLTLATRT
jgi:hypothetical protein